MAVSYKMRRGKIFVLLNRGEYRNGSTAERRGDEKGARAAEEEEKWHP